MSTSGSLPRELGGHVLEEELHAGRRSRVFRATRDRRLVALKVFEPDADVDRAVLERFQRGFPGRIRHPNLVPLETIGEIDSRVYCSMQFLRGDSLRRVLDDLAANTSSSLGPLAVGPSGELHPDHLRHAVELIAGVAEGLERAHEAGILHLHLSPSHLTFSPAGRLVVTGFDGRKAGAGMAGAGKEGTCRADANGESSGAGGDLPYLAPEQIRGGPVDARADVYGLGAILYELVTLRPPFADSDPESLRAAILRRSPVPPRSLRPEVSVALERTILRCLAKDPSQRCESAGQLALDLRALSRCRMPSFQIAAATELENGTTARLRAENKRLLAENEELVGETLRLGAARRRSEEESARLARSSQAAQRRLERMRRWTAVLAGAGVLALALALWFGIRAEIERRGETMAASRLGAAASSLAAGDPAGALAQIEMLSRRGRPLVDELRGKLRDIVAADPLQRDLADTRPAVRLAAIETLETEITARRRDVSDVQLAARAFRDGDDRVRAAAIAAYSKHGGAGRLLADLGHDPDGPPLAIDGASFLRIHDTLLHDGGAEALALLGRWSLDDMERLDRGEAELRLEPNLCVEPWSAEPGAFTRAWIERSSWVAPEALLEALPRIIERDELVAALLDAIVRMAPCASGEAPQTELASRARSETPSPPLACGRATEIVGEILHLHVLGHGREAIAALASLGDWRTLASIATSSLPLSARREAIDRIASGRSREARSQLATLALRNPHSDLRRRAMDHLARADSAPEASEIPALMRALEDDAARAPALARIGRVADDRRSRLAFELIGHSDASVRAKALEWAAGDESLAATGLAILGTLSESSRKRQAAIDLLSRRSRTASRPAPREPRSSLVERSVALGRAVVRVAAAHARDLEMDLRLLAAIERIRAWLGELSCEMRELSASSWIARLRRLLPGAPSAR